MAALGYGGPVPEQIQTIVPFQTSDSAVTGM